MILKNEKFGYPSFCTHPIDEANIGTLDQGIVVMETFRGAWVWWDLYTLKPVDVTCEESICLMWEAWKNGDDEVEIPYECVRE